MVAGSCYVWGGQQAEELAAAGTAAIRIVPSAQQPGVQIAPVPGRGLRGTSHLKERLQLQRPQRSKAVTLPLGGRVRVPFEIPAAALT